MSTQRFTEQMQAYGRWRAQLLEAIGRYQGWLDEHDMGEPEDELRLFEIMQGLRSDRLTIAFVAEFSRGKTELINAIFFSEYDRRLLPSEAGRTTMCPTELFYDHEADEAYVRLLPLETRLQDTSIAEYKKDPIQWTTIPLELDRAEHMAEAFQEIVRTKQVPAKEAWELGLLTEEPEGEQAEAAVEVPLWRHALISFPHPLLKEGLVILDTPGLNAMGSEPELTLNMLPNAQAVVFVLAADTGATKSDQEMWRHHVQPLRGSGEKGLMVVLNKVDTLWDELKTPEQIDATIHDQCGRVGETLGVGRDQVFPVSAQKGLLAKIRHDEALLERSNILALEGLLAQDILPQKQQIVRQHVSAGVGAMVEASHDLLDGRLNSVNKQLEELRGLSDKNNEVIQHLMRKTREEQVAYYKNVESFQANKKILSEQSKKLMQMLSLTELDRAMSDTRKQMNETWTTVGLKTNMKQLFERLDERLQQTARHTDQLNRLALTIYRKFHQEHGLAEVKPKPFSLAKYVRKLRELEQEAEAYRNSPVTTMTEQSFVIRKFFISLVSHARNLFYEAHKDAEEWSKAVMAPLVRQIKEHKEQMEKRLENLRKISESRETVASRVEELEASAEKLEAQLAEVRDILATIRGPETEAEEPPATAGAAGG